MPTDPTRAQAIFVAAAEIADPAARTVYLAEACGGDPALLARVEALLRAYDQPDSLLDAPLVAPPDLDHDTTQAYSPDREPAAARSGDAEDDEALGFLSPSTRADSLGRIGHYEALQVLGKGGFGIVFRAFDDVLQRVVAVKVMAPQLAATSPARKRFLREARTSAAVRHENVVQVYEVAEQPLPYLAMEFIPGETLQQHLDRKGPLEVPEVLRIGRQIAEGLAAAHATDLIHRDIKPANVLIEGGPRKQVKITDFGLARAADDASISQSGIIAGTPMYMAPEQALGQDIDQRADLFSLGSVLYQMAAGRAPFRANSTLAVLKRVAEDTPRDIRAIIPETPQWLCDIVGKLHAKNPDGRYQSAREVADVLADCEAQLKANSKLKDFSRIPRSKQHATGKSGRWKWVAAAALLLPLIAFGMTELAGVTHLFRVATVQPTGLAESQLPDDKARLQGRWRMVALEEKGKSVPVGEHVFGYRAEFIGDAHVAYHADGKPFSLPFVLNPGADPKEIDFLTRQGPIRSIYRFDGDKLIVALGGPGPGRPRPTGFTTTPDTSFSVATWVRDTGPMPGQTGWVQLFNGKDLTGWHTSESDKWTVKDGVLVGNARGTLFSDAAYRDFHIRAEVRSNPESNGTLAFRTTSSRHGEVGVGHHDAESGKPGSVNVYLSPRGRFVAGPAERLTSAGEWFDLELIVRGKRATVSINGKTTADVSVPELADAGGITLNAYEPGTELQFRKIEIKALPASASSLPPPFKNTLGMEFVKVPKGKSWLGGGAGKMGDKEVEIPADFYLSKYEVTQEEWEKVMGENPSHFSRTGEGKGEVKDVSDADLKRFPVEKVSWDQCQSFVAKLNKLEKGTGWVYRLPTQVEWEYACRGGPMADKADSAFDFYLTKPTNTLLPEQANFGLDKGLDGTRQVGAYAANRLGLSDMHGNVFEWCDDSFTDSRLGELHRVHAGGAWHGGSAVGCRAAGNVGRSPSEMSNGVGLRLARVPAGTLAPDAKTPPLAP